MGTDYVDLFQFHLNEYDGPEISELQGALEDLVAAGKIRAYGWSTDHPDRVRRWLGGSGFKAVQAEINVLQDNPAMWEIAEANRLACLNRGPLAMGLLTGKYTADTRIGRDDVRGASPEWLRFFVGGAPAPEYLRRLDAVRDVLTSDGRSLVHETIRAAAGVGNPLKKPGTGVRSKVK